MSSNVVCVWGVQKGYRRGQRYNGTACFICAYAPNLATWVLTKWYFEGMCSLKVQTVQFFIEEGESVSVSETLSKAELIPDITISV